MLHQRASTQAASRTVNPGGQDSYQDCLDAGYRYLSYRARSEAEIRSYLKRKGFHHSSIEKVLLKLIEQKLADDVAFARLWAENRQRFRPRSRAMLKRELTQKGIAATVIAEVTSELDEEGSAYRAARQKAKSLAGADYPDFRRKLFSFLRRRGFNYEICQHTTGQLWQEGEDNSQSA